MTVIELCQRGAVLYNPKTGEEDLIDLAVSGDGATMFMRLNWWRNAWGMGDPIILPGEPEDRAPYPGFAVASPSNEVHILPPEDKPDRAALQAARDLTDYNREEYLEQVGWLKRAFPAEYADGMGAWIDEFEKRPRRNAEAEAGKRNLRNREFGLVRLMGTDGETADLLIVDEDGNAVTLKGLDKLPAFAASWADQNSREVAAYVQSIAEDQRPYGPYEFSDARTFHAEGHIEDVAIRYAKR